ncbi:glycerophosphodiester phosphodiesterase [Paenibacillus sp. YYML68]|uniref:glycerophosphodiester phosphodiesterase n=1 Tax=Paenibacillus sp. YYML68 TaxID=2909250 RepID=UPI0024929C73|nr:glycerophosphodiester phosphodiesterase [Paenibacillus sp. YYML68]
MKHCRIIAHTGCENTPYNSIESCIAGYKAGADVLEVDVRSTKDGIAVLYHDDEPDLRNYTYDEWTAAGHEPIVKLETVMQLLRGKPIAFNLDLKTKEAYEAAAQVLTAWNAWNQVYFTGLTDHIARSEHAKHVVWNVPRIDPDLPDESYKAIAQRYCEHAKQSGFSGVNVHYEACRSWLIYYAREYGLMVWIFTLPNNEALIQHYIEMGVDAISVYDLTLCLELRQRWLA